MGETDKQGQLVPSGIDQTGALVEVRGEAFSDTDAEIAELRASIEVTRERISSALDNVQESVQEKLIWREWIQDHPYKTIGIAFGIGYLLGRV